MKRWASCTAVIVAVAISGCGSESEGGTATKTVTASAPATETVTAPATSAETTTPAETDSADGQESSDTDPDRPDDSLDVGQSGTVGNLEVTLKKFQEVTPDEPMDGWTHYGAQLNIKNDGDGPEEVLASAQTGLENIYVATVEPISNEIAEGEQLLLDTMRPGSSIEGWVVFAVPDDSELMDSFGLYFDDFEGNEVVWWNPLSE